MIAVETGISSNLSKVDISKSKVRERGDISSFFSSLGEDGKPPELPEVYAKIKKSLVKDPTGIRESWLRLKELLKKAIEEIEEKGISIIPTVEYSELDSLTDEKLAEIKNRGTLVVKNVIPQSTAEGYKSEVLKYVEENPHTNGFPKDKKVVYELYWSKPQVKARSHPNLITTLNFMNGLWHASPEAEVCLQQNVSYADRLRIRNAGDDLFSLGPHADGGSVERWEDKEYTACYRSIFDGKWEDYDPFDADHRINAKQDLHDSKGSCSVFRTFQGWLAVSTIAPKEGAIQFAPKLKEVTAYYLLRPFFDENDNINFDATLPGAFPAKQLEFNNKTHPDLNLEKLMVSIPKVNPGDMVFWHCDTIHSVDPVHEGKHDSSVFYIPSSPLCMTNVAYGLYQREAFSRGLVAPDYPGFPHDIGEQEHVGRATFNDVFEAGGYEAMKQFLLTNIDVKKDYSVGAKEAIEKANDAILG